MVVDIPSRQLTEKANVDPALLYAAVPAEVLMHTKFEY